MIIMRHYLKAVRSINAGYLHLPDIPLPKITCTKFYHTAPFLEFYKNTTGNTISEDYLKVLKKKHPHIDEISHDRIQCTLQILQKFGITAQEACQHLHVFSMNPITMDNYGEILKECGFIKISPPYIIKYHTLVKSRTISQLKKLGMLPQDIILEQNVLDKLEDWPQKTLSKFPDSQTSILMVRINILERYLSWKLSVTTEEFQKYCKNYLPLKHKPMCDIQEAIKIAQNDLELDNTTIRRNGFLLSMDPLHTKLMLQNVKTLAGMDIREAIKLEPAILKNNYNSVLQVRNIMEENKISNLAQRRCLKIYCMCPETVQQRLDELKNTKEYKILSTNPRVLFMVVHKKKMINRLKKIETSNKRCYSLNSLVGSTKVFNTYLSSFGEKVCSKDLAALIISSLSNLDEDAKVLDLQNILLKQLKRQKYWLHAAISVVHENVLFLKERFNDRTILNNCQLLLYPVLEVKQYINMLLNIRERSLGFATFSRDLHYNTLKSSLLSDDQILSLVLYEMEKKYHFSGDGIWAKQDGAKLEVQSLK